MSDSLTAPVIGLPGRRKTSAQVEGFPPLLDHLELDMYMADYARSVLRAGGLPIHLPMDADPVAYLPLLDGLVLTGGGDVDPARYGHENTASDVDTQRDELEFGLLQGALDDELPILGICRGLQLMNVHDGGSLHQDVPAHARYDVGPATLVHDIAFEPHSRLGLMYGAHAEVNSLHHQTVDTVGPSYMVAARSEDGTIEGLEMQGRDVIAVQWHPEMMDPSQTIIDPVFEWLVKRSAARR